MDFYHQIAKYYDDIFPAGKAQLEFLASIAGRPPKSVLDIACGTGTYSLELARLGYSVTAIDLDANMIDILKKKSGLLDLNKRVEALQGNMLQLPEWLNSSYDMAFCIGNSLVHLDGAQEIEKFFIDIKNLLVERGHFAIQIINYDRVLNGKVTSLPTIENHEQDLKFHRLYRYDKETNRIFFKTILEVKGQVLENEIPLYPLLSEEMDQLLKGAGFKEIQQFGDFQKSRFQKDTSFALVIDAS